MKIMDYKLLVAQTAEDLRQDVLALAREGWEVHGPPQLRQVPFEMWQAMVKKFDLHEGQVWVKEPGFPGRWEKVG